MVYKLSDLFAAIVAAMLSAAYLIYVPLQGWRILPALLLGFVLPGYMIMCATLQTRSLKTSEKITVTLGTSMAAVVVGGVLLNFSPWGLTTLGWVLWLGGITLAAGLIAILRRLLTKSERPLHERAKPNRLRKVQFVPLLSIGLIVFIVAGYQTVHSTIEQPRPGFTEFWFVPDESSDMDAFVGVINNEHRAESYCLEVVTDDWTIYEACPIKLSSGEKWEVKLRLSADMYSRGGIVARLFRSDDPDNVYREAWLQSTFD
jgi:uncharacterized membrane protein